MSVVEHLTELRKRILLSLGAVAVGMVGGWFLFRPVFNLLSNPFCGFMTKHPNLAVDPKDPCRLVYLSVIEPFLIKIKIVGFIGLIIALPVVLYQVWLFITPGLTTKERKYAIPFVVSSLVLFALGGWFALLTLPKGLNFLLGFAWHTRVFTVLSIAKYLGFVILMILVFGASFEFPLLLISLILVGVLSSRKLRDWRRNAIILIAVFAAVITPSQDAFTMTAMMLPLIIFYELSILVGRLLKK